MQDLVRIPVEKPVCPECHGTGKITLFTGIVDCKACKPEQSEPVVWKDEDIAKYLCVGAVCVPAYREREFYRRLFGDGCGF